MNISLAPVLGGRQLREIVRGALGLLGDVEIALCDALNAFSGFEDIRQRPSRPARE